LKSLLPQAGHVERVFGIEIPMAILLKPIDTSSKRGIPGARYSNRRKLVASQKVASMLPTISLGLSPMFRPSSTGFWKGCAGSGLHNIPLSKKQENS